MNMADLFNDCPMTQMSPEQRQGLGDKHLLFSDFFRECVTEDVAEAFVIKEELIKSFIGWRQEQSPMMQLIELDAAEEDLIKEFPESAYKQQVVAGDTVHNGQVGKLVYTQCWTGFKLLRKVAPQDKVQPHFVADEPKECTALGWDAEPDTLVTRQLDNIRTEMCDKFDAIYTLLKQIQSAQRRQSNLATI